MRRKGRSKGGSIYVLMYLNIGEEEFICPVLFYSRVTGRAYRGLLETYVDSRAGLPSQNSDQFLVLQLPPLVEMRFITSYQSMTGGLYGKIDYRFVLEEACKLMANT